MDNFVRYIIDMSLIQWIPALSVGVKELDDQHKKVFEIINKVYDGLSIKSDKKLLPDVFQDLIDYANVHLKREEFYFEKFDYPEKESHVATHNAYREKIKNFQKRWESGESGVIYEITKFLNDWWQNHIYKVDKRYTIFFQEHGLK